MEEIGIYVHIPFCKKKCYYCDFISYANVNEKMFRYVECLKKEIEKTKNKQVCVTTIYFGGGTPSFLEAIFIEQILDVIRKNYVVDKNAEITIEVNPGTVNKEKLEQYKTAGINRLSIGLQSTKNELLKEIGRIHTYEEFLITYKLARKVGFKNINVDLMLGLPKQTLEYIEESLKDVVELKPEHISVYSLIIEENTKIQKMIEEGILNLPDEEIERKMYWDVKQYLEQQGYIHYEISNFAKKGYNSKHNMNCWKQQEYLGFGVAAHSYKDGKRYCNTEKIEEYCKNIEDEKSKKNRTILEEQTKIMKEKEYMILGLRLIDGVNIQEFKNKFVDNPIYVFYKELEKLVSEELVEVDLNQIKLTNRGLDFANLVWQEFC